jgi:tRNA A37 threonylcarbamoyladenosine synthetase subunit TsaC/SUA5/YrdC
MTLSARITRAVSHGVAVGLLSVFGSAAIALPTANADPQCNTTVGESIDSYLNRHPDVRQELAERGQAESPGSPNPVLDYLNSHPDVRQALITLSGQCTS